MFSLLRVHPSPPSHCLFVCSSVSSRKRTPCCAGISFHYPKNLVDLFFFLQYQEFGFLLGACVIVVVATILALVLFFEKQQRLGIRTAIV